MNPFINFRRWPLRTQVRIAMCIFIAATALLLAELMARHGTDGETADLHHARREAMAWAAGLGGLGALLSWWMVGQVIAREERATDAPLRHERTPFPTGVQPRRRSDAQPIPTMPAALHDAPKGGHGDILTGLRSLAELNPLAERLVQDERFRTMEFCLLRLDLDGFKGINDRCGHEAGDQVLVQTAKRLRHLSRDEDFLFRLGDDEFLMLLTCPAGEGSALARRIAARIIADVQRPMNYRTLSNLRVGCSIGSAVWSGTGDTLVDTLRHAEEAMQAAKQGGRGNYRHYAFMPATPPARRIEPG